MIEKIKELQCENCKLKINKKNFWKHKHKTYIFTK
jgi:hypothetical protein